MKKYLIAFGAVVVVALMYCRWEETFNRCSRGYCYLCRPARRYFVEYSRRFLWTRYQCRRL